VTPEVPAARVADRPAQHRVTGVAGVVVAGVELDPVPVGIAQVDVEGIGHAVPAGSALDQELLVQRAEDVADPQHLVRLMHEERHMVQAGPVSPGERHVVHGLLAEHPGRVEGLLVLDRLGQAEPQGRVVLIGSANVGDHQVEVVDPGGFGAAPQVIALLQALGPVRGGEELDGEAQRVLGPDRLAHAGGGAGRDPGGARAEGGVERLGPVQVGRRAYPEGQPRRRGRAALAQDQVVVDELVVPAQVQRIAGVRADHEAEQVDPEPARFGQVGDDELGVGRADDIGRGRQCLRGRGHGQAPNRGTWVSPSGMWTIRESV
jgi:hypothetical protein